MAPSRSDTGSGSDADSRPDPGPASDPDSDADSDPDSRPDSDLGSDFPEFDSGAHAFDADPAETDADSELRDWRRLEPGLRRAWSALDVGKAAVPVLVGTLVVSVPYVLVVTWVTDALLSVADGLTPEIAFGIVVFLTLTTFSSFLFSAVMLVERLLPWESPLAL